MHVWTDIPWPLWVLMEGVYRLGRTVEELEGINPSVLLKLLGEDHHQFWQLCLKAQRLASALYRIGAAVEREVLRQAKVVADVKAKGEGGDGT